MPPENRVGRDDRGDLTESATAQPVSVHRQPTAFLIGQTDPAAQVRAEDAVFFDQIGNRLLPLVGPPAGHRHHEESNRSDIHDRGSLHYRLHGAPESTSAEKCGTLRGCATSSRGGSAALFRPQDIQGARTIAHVTFRRFRWALDQLFDRRLGDRRQRAGQGI